MIRKASFDQPIVTQEPNLEAPMDKPLPGSALGISGYGDTVESSNNLPFGSTFGDPTFAATLQVTRRGDTLNEQAERLITTIGGVS